MNSKVVLHRVASCESTSTDNRIALMIANFHELLGSELSPDPPFWGGGGRVILSEVLSLGLTSFFGVSYQFWVESGPVLGLPCFFGHLM